MKDNNEDRFDGEEFSLSSPIVIQSKTELQIQKNKTSYINISR
jgi:hypothetical protein